MTISRMRCLLLLGVLLTVLAGCRGSTDAADDDRAESEKVSVPDDRTTITATVAKESGIHVATAGPATIHDEHTVQGLLTPVEGRNVRVIARFPGLIRRVTVGVGDQVRRGQVLATIESNLSLSDYTLVAPFDGTVLARQGAVGDLAGSAPLFEIADLSRLWVDLHLFGGDAQHLRAGLPVTVIRLADGATVTTTVDRILPGTATASQSTVARAVIPNSDGNWRPGAAVQARISVSADTVTLAVPLTAVQSWRGRDTVFVQQGDTYIARPVSLGRRDSQQAEVRQGLKAGEHIVVAESYLIKADLEKASVVDED